MWGGGEKTSAFEMVSPRENAKTISIQLFKIIIKLFTYMTSSKFFLHKRKHCDIITIATKKAPKGESPWKTKKA